MMGTQANEPMKLLQAEGHRHCLLIKGLFVVESFHLHIFV